MQGCGVKHQPSQDAIGFCFAKDLNEGVCRMSVQVVPDHINQGYLGIQDIHEIPQGFSQVFLGAPPSHQYVTAARFGFNKDEDIPSASTLIFVILPPGAARLEGESRAAISQ